MFFLSFSRNYKILLGSCLLVFCISAHANSSKTSAPWIGDTLAGSSCQGKGQNYGPYDYTQRSQLTKQLGLVEGAHFNENVESLRGGAKQKYNLYGDIDYTLRAFPNHHRALNSVIKLRTLYGAKHYKQKMSTPAECYLQRAINFSPKDASSFMLYGILLHKIGDFDNALIQYKKAEQQSAGSAEIQYNLGLLFIEMERFDEAKVYALKAYAQKFPLKGLMKRLKKSGHW
ncbi:hypothetical protein [Neptunomonas sp.]|uniref:hypothetical protein n=1 Tax=Neptunomonas sp. TaxID=1971898 RepID=UPI0025FC3513|nr:hypothetical protein [Neptunomonas sp.]